MKNRVRGMDVPDDVVKRMADTPKEKNRRMKASPSASKPLNA
ncbi:MAG: hypothetical protein R2861_10805 [Desulfobacterales bacterium]